MHAFFLFIVLILSVNFSWAQDVQCDPQRSIRKLSGPEPITSKLHLEAKKNFLLFEKGQFDEEQFSYIGRIKISSGRSWHIVLLETVWGCSGRSTSRLFVFSSAGRYIGQYSHFSGRQPRVDGDTVIFDDVTPELGNRIVFTSGGPPERAWIDGENPGFYK